MIAGRIFRRVLAAVILLSGPVAAQDLIIATRTDVSSIDPHFHTVGHNIGAASHVFEPLLRLDDRLRLHPALALSVKPWDDTTWEIRLRPNVTFHDGTPFTAEDVAFTLARIPLVPNSPLLFTTHTRAIREVKVVDPLTLHIVTHTPSPSFPNDLAKLSIVSKRAAEGKTTADFNSGAATIGTGPYRFTRWTPASRIQFERNPTYWGPPEPWQRVTLRPIQNDTARTAALLAGDVDVIEAVPVTEHETLAANPKFAVFDGESIRIIYIHLDANRDRSPMITSPDGQPLDRNPLKDWRVRQAINLAINRAAITDKLLNGLAKPIGQLVPDFIFGASPDLPPPPFDPARAEALLKEAGWHNRFAITLATSNDRYPKDTQVAQAVAQMLTRVGIKTTVEAMPISMLFSRGSKLEFSMLIAGTRADSGEGGMMLVQLLATHDPARGMGGVNRGRYSNPKLDATLATALATMDDTKRAALIAEAMEIGMRDVGMLTLYVMSNSWAARKGITVVPRADELTIATSMRPQSSP